MWTHTLLLALVAIGGLLLVDASFNEFPTDAQNINQQLICMVPGVPPPNPVPTNDDDTKRSVPSNRPSVPALLLVVNLVPGLLNEAWGLPGIEVQAPYGTLDFNLLDIYLNATPAMNMVTSKTDRTGEVPPNPNDVFGLVVEPPTTPKLDQLSADDSDTVERYVAAAGIIQCPGGFRFVQRPAFYYPPFQVQGFCSGDACGLPTASDHSFGQFCRPRPDALQPIRALRWDCCYSWVGATQDWEFVCGWRTVVVHILTQCMCSCEHDSGQV